MYRLLHAIQSHRRNASRISRFVRSSSFAQRSGYRCPPRGLITVGMPVRTAAYPVGNE